MQRHTSGSGQFFGRNLLRPAASGIVLLSLLATGYSANAAAESKGRKGKSGQESPAPTVVVHSKFGGQIFGFDIDQAGNLGVLSEAMTISGGKSVAAVETFDQTTGQILKVITRIQGHDDFLTWGVVAGGIGLLEHEHSFSLFHVKRTYPLLNPLSATTFNGLWTPPLDRNGLIQGISRNQGTSQVAVYGFENDSSFISFVFGSDVAANTFGPVVNITDANFSFSHSPQIALNTQTNQAVLAAQGNNAFGPPALALVDLTTGDITNFTGVGIGLVNGLAVDSNTQIACTTTEIDFSVEFYNLTTQAGFSVFLPGATNQAQSGADVQVDSIHRLFLVAQPVSSTAASGSSIHVYDEHGHLVNSINGLNFSNAFNVVPAHIAINPTNRSGFVDGPDQGVTSIQSFTY